MADYSCPLHTYTEESARAKLARHRKRGEDYRAFWCPFDGLDHWHVVSQQEWEELIGGDERGK